jgi:hypothetical protein
MIVHQNAVLSRDLFKKNFVCDLAKCKGACCVEGDYGAPLLESEIEDIDRNLESVKKYMTGEALELLMEDGFHEKDPDAELVTNCISGRNCIFVYKEEKIYKCAIEKAYENGESDFKKPISCHLYPIRINRLGPLEGLNYNHWDICSPACKLGDKLKVPVFQFVKDALIRKYGEDWYEELEIIAEELEIE